MVHKGAQEFDVAVSFAGEDRDFVKEVFRGLDSERSVFFDEDFIVETWGRDLVEYFADLYQNRARYVVMFVSRHYAEKSWTTHERRSALATAITQQSPYILPVRLDDTQLPGLLPTVGYVDARRVGAQGVIDSINAKLAGTQIALPARSLLDGRAPRTFEAQGAAAPVRRTQGDQVAGSQAEAAEQPIRPDRVIPKAEPPTHVVDAYQRGGRKVGEYVVSSLKSLGKQGGDEGLRWQRIGVAVAILSLVVGVVGIIVVIVVPEIRCAVQLDSCPSSSQSPDLRTPAPSQAFPISAPIPIGKACRWAYASATGHWRGSRQGIECLDVNGNSLGGFPDGSGHSLNDWCSNPRHTEGNPTLRQARLVRQASAHWECVPVGT
jgi:hypothetical protein